MPRPDWLDGEYDPTEAPDTRIELVGRGRRSRATKTNIPDIEAATILQRIGNVAADLADILQRLHAAHYTVTETIKDEATGKVTVNTVPEILSYKELRERYPAIRMWEEGHQGQVEHLVSVKGFSVIRATGGNEAPQERESRPDNSAGADAGKAKGSRWR
jgi:hypothetical protein